MCDWFLPVFEEKKYPLKVLFAQGFFGPSKPNN